MTITLGEIIVWIIVGALAGTVAGSIVTRTKEGFGRFKNFLIGIAGAVIGGLIFNLLKIEIFPSLVITFEDLLSAILGALLLVFILHMINKKKK